MGVASTFKKGKKNVDGGFSKFKNFFSNFKKLASNFNEFMENINNELEQANQLMNEEGSIAQGMVQNGINQESERRFEQDAQQEDQEQRSILSDLEDAVGMIDQQADIVGKEIKITEDSEKASKKEEKALYQLLKQMEKKGITPKTKKEFEKGLKAVADEEEEEADEIKYEVKEEEQISKEIYQTTEEVNKVIKELGRDIQYLEELVELAESMGAEKFEKELDQMLHRKEQDLKEARNLLQELAQEERKVEEEEQETKKEAKEEESQDEMEEKIDEEFVGLAQNTGVFNQKDKQIDGKAEEEAEEAGRETESAMQELGDENWEQASEEELSEGMDMLDDIGSEVEKAENEAEN